MGNPRFKFRVWDNTTNHYWFNGSINIDSNANIFIIPVDSNEKLYYLSNAIIEQCTGLKDKNGNLIYEGDKVEISVYGDVINEGFVETDTQYQGIVVWAKQGFYVKVVDEFFYIPEEPENVEIIGNIHETKGGKDGSN